MPTLIGEELLERAVGYRHGVVPSVQIVRTTACDIPGVWHAAAPRSGAHRWDSPAGGVGWSRDDARHGAIGEALERYAAVACRLPERTRDTLPPEQVIPLARFSLFSARQQVSPRFPHTALFDDHAAGGGTFTNAFDLATNEEWWLPRFLVGLADPAGQGLATSSGLAAAASPHLALLRATQELVERDALMTTWNHSLPGRRVRIPSRYQELVEALGGDLVLIDATPAYSPHPVALVTGWVPQRGRRRIGLGAACRSTWAAAVDKAFLEWCQGVLFAGVFTAWHPDLRYRDPGEVVTFEDHAAYYTVHPDRWERVPLLSGPPSPGTPPPGQVSPGPPGEELAGLAAVLRTNGLRLWYRDLTTCDLSQIGIWVMRVVSTDCTPIHAIHAWPYLGGRASDVAWRYPWAAPGSPPNSSPHPLG